MRWALHAPGGNALVKNDASKPCLIFIHGTFSSTEGAFSGLGEPNNRSILKNLRSRFGNEIYALEHKTVSQSPIQNAMSLLSGIPAGSELYLVSHSRGGLIGELIALGELFIPDSNGKQSSVEEVIDLAKTKINYQLYGEQENDIDGAENEYLELKRLFGRLREKYPKVKSFVRVAAPMNGTELLNRNFGVSALIRYSLNAARKSISTASLSNPFVRGFANLLGETLAEIGNNLDDPGSVPGIAAMVPGSPLPTLLSDIVVEHGV